MTQKSLFQWILHIFSISTFQRPSSLTISSLHDLLKLCLMISSFLQHGFISENASRLYSSFLSQSFTFSFYFLFTFVTRAVVISVIVVFLSFRDDECCQDRRYWWQEDKRGPESERIQQHDVGYISRCFVWLLISRWEHLIQKAGGLTSCNARACVTGQIFTFIRPPGFPVLSFPFAV